MSPARCYVDPSSQRASRLRKRTSFLRSGQSRTSEGEGVHVDREQALLPSSLARLRLGRGVSEMLSSGGPPYDPDGPNDDEEKVRDAHPRDVRGLLSAT